MGNILDQIVETKRAEVVHAKSRRPLAVLRAAISGVSPARDFHAAIASPPLFDLHLIAEIKRRSPSGGLLREDFDPVAIASIYHRQGASALSVLTDVTYFDGRLEFIDRVKAAVPLPVLRKDFIIDEYQVYESRAAGADAILLIGEILPPAQLRDLLDLAFELGMTTLVEVHHVQTLADVLKVVPFPNQRRSLMGINNRDLTIQQTDISTTSRLAGMLGAGTLLVSESGIKTRDDVLQLKAAGASALLIGETFMRSPDIGAKMAELFNPSQSLGTSS